MAKVVIDGVEYVPRAEVPELADGPLKECLRSLVEIQLFRSEQHKHRAWGWDALNSLSPELAAMCTTDPHAAMERVEAHSFK